MKIVQESIAIDELRQMSEKMFGQMVKAVVDIEQGIMVVDAPLHVDEELLLLEEGSQQTNLWGINLHPAQFPHEDWVEFDSMINLRPSWGNKTRGVDDAEVRKSILAIVARLVY